MNLPNPILLEDANWQLAHAAERVAPFIEALELRTENEPTDPAKRPAYEQTIAMLRALKVYFERADALVELLITREDEMQQEMAKASFLFREMRVERDWLKRECQELGERYYTERDGVAEFLERWKDKKPA